MRDLEQIDRDATRDTWLDRDREREPRPIAHLRHQLRERSAAAPESDVPNRAKGYTIRLVCPACQADSDREQVDCSSCEAPYTTRRTIEGVDVVPLAPGGGA